MKNNSYIYFCVLLLGLFCSCSNRPKYDLFTNFTWDDFGKPQFLQGELVNFDEMLMNPTRIWVVDSFLVTKNSNLDKSFYVYNLNTRKKVGERIVRGNGPQEMLDPVLVRLSDDNLAVLDKQMKRMDMYQKHVFFESESPLPFKSNPVKELLMNPVLVPNLGFVSATFESDRKLVAYDFDGNLISYFGNYPEGYEDAPVLNKFTWFDHDFAVHSDGSCFVAAHKRTDMLEFYDKDLMMFRRIQGPDNFYPPTERNMEFRPGYFFPVATDDCFYVLYDGRVYNQNSPERYLQRNLLVFDWEGKPLKHYQLSEGIIHFSLDEKNRVIYGVSDYPDFHIVSFPLSN